MGLPAQYTEKDLTRARHRGQLIGWLQGGGAVIAGAVVLNLLGWIPALLAVGFVGYATIKVVKWMSKPSAEGGGDS